MAGVEGLGRARHTGLIAGLHRSGNPARRQLDDAPAGRGARLSRSVAQRGALDHPVWLVARTVAMKLRPDMTEEEAGRRVIEIVAWTAREHTEWFWQGTGEWKGCSSGKTGTGTESWTTGHPVPQVGTAQDAGRDQG